MIDSFKVVVHSCHPALRGEEVGLRRAGGLTAKNAVDSGAPLSICIEISQRLCDHPIQAHSESVGPTDSKLRRRGDRTSARKDNRRRAVSVTMYCVKWLAVLY